MHRTIDPWVGVQLAAVLLSTSLAGGLLLAPRARGLGRAWPRRATLAAVALAGAALTAGLLPEGPHVAGATAGDVLAWATRLVVLGVVVAVVVRRRAVRGALLVDGGVLGIALALCLVADSPFTMIGGMRGAHGMPGMPGMPAASGWAAATLGRVTPVLDSLLVVACVFAALSGDHRLPAARRLGLASGVVLGATVAAELETGLGRPWLGLLATSLWCAALVTAAAAVAGPGSAGLLEPYDHEHAAWSRARIVVVLTSFALPLYCLSTHAVLTETVAALLAGMFAMVALIMTRAVVAVRALSAARADLEHRATHDALTGLPNRAAVADRLQSALSGGEPVGVYFVDLNGFKLVNDSLGHDRGDELLRALADRLRQSLPGAFTVARFGGDEFVVVEPVPSDCAATAELIASVVGRPAVIGGMELATSASVGVTRWDGSRPAGVDDLLREADTAMYRAKSGGGDQVAHYTGGLRERAVADLTLGQSFRRAVSSGELGVTFEPMVSVGTGDLVGMEALMRWSSPVLGVVAPNRFIPVAEDQHRLDEAFRLTLDRALAARRLWAPHEGTRLEPVVTVNVSSAQLRDQRVATTVGALLAEHGLDGSALWLELTESRPIDDLPAARAAMAAVRDLGVQWALDDFGTGYSATALLLDLPVSVVKIDRRFVESEALPDRNVVARTTELAHSMGLVVVAEGCDNPATLDRMAQAGVDIVQGHWVTRALPGRPGRPVAVSR